jgi:type IV pilus assembly protein PilB
LAKTSWPGSWIQRADGGAGNAWFCTRGGAVVSLGHHEPYGVVLVTGPTGSGKSTTLYAVLREVSTMEVSTFTLEDPIEYRMSLVRQTQITRRSG